MESFMDLVPLTPSTDEAYHTLYIRKHNKYAIFDIILSNQKTKSI